MDQVRELVSALAPSLKPGNTVPNEKTLREDIRMLGRLLGDTLREQEGVATFELIENIRQCSVRFRRDRDPEAKTQLDAILNRLDNIETIAVVRAFSFFSQLTNIADDLYQNRCWREQEIAGEPPQAGSVAYAIERDVRQSEERRVSDEHGVAALAHVDALPERRDPRAQQRDRVGHRLADRPPHVAERVAELDEDVDRRRGDPRAVAGPAKHARHETIEVLVVGWPRQDAAREPIHRLAGDPAIARDPRFGE